MKNKDFVIFIITHERANEQKTLKALLERNYKGKIYLVVDNLDKQMMDYVEKYKGQVIVFDKEQMHKITNTMDNFHNLSSAVYARNFVQEYAKKYNIEYYAIFDDDIEYFCYRYNNFGFLSRKELTDINKIFDIYINFLKTTNIAGIGFGNEGGYFGGTEGKFSKQYGRTINQAMIINGNKNIKFLGTQNEDYNIILRYFYELFIEIYGVSILTPKRGTNKGGNDYNLSGMYVSNFYSVMLAPSYNKIRIKKGNIILIKKLGNGIPQIISEVYKK